MTSRRSRIRWSGGVYGAGTTSSLNLPIAGPAAQRAPAGSTVSGVMDPDGLLARFSSDGSPLLSGRPTGKDRGRTQWY
jgi:hypothetical protein